MTPFVKGHKISNRRKVVIAAYSDMGWVEDMTGNHDSFNVYRWKNANSETKIIEDRIAEGYDFVRSCYKFRTAKRALQDITMDRAKPWEIVGRKNNKNV